MTASFKNILIPVDFSINTELAVKKVIELAEPDSSVHLLHVRQEANEVSIFSLQQFFPQSKHILYDGEVEYKIDEWKKSISDNSMCKKVFCRIITGSSIQQVITDEARRLSIDLVIIGKNSTHSWLPFLNTVIPSQLSREIGAAVLTLKPGSIYNKVKTMIVPISNENAINKLEIIYAICKKFPVKIHLVTFMNSNEKEEGNHASTLLRLYQSLRSSLNCHVEYAILKSNNKVKAILNYAEKFNADILLVNPETETKIGWPNKHISDVLPAGSRIQVWAV